MMKPIDINIIHQTQTEAFNCVSTCIAMLVGRPVERITEEFHPLYFSGAYSVEEYLSTFRIRALPCFSRERELKWGHVYLITVPSINLEGHLHQVILDCRDPEAGSVVYDPNTGRPDRKTYVARLESVDDPSKQVPLQTYVVDYILCMEADREISEKSI